MQKETADRYRARCDSRDSRLEGMEAGHRQQSLDALCSQWTGNHELEPGWTWVEAMGMEDLEEGARGGRLPGKPQSNGCHVGFIMVLCCDDAGTAFQRQGSLSKGYTLLCQLAVFTYLSNMWGWDVLFACMCMLQMCVWSPKSLEEVIRSSRANVKL